MGRLFWKFFFSFWLSVILTGLGVGGAVWLADQSWHDSGAKNDTQPRFIPPESEALLKVAAELIKVGDFNALRLLLARFDEHSWLTVYVIDSKDQDLLGRQIAASDILRARTHAKQANTSETTTVKVGDSGDSYLVFIKHDRIYDKIGLFEASIPADLRRSGSPNSRSFPAGEFLSPPPHVFGASPFRRPPSPIAVLFVLGLISSLLASLLLARHFAKPIWQLRTALLSVADGNLDTRIAPVMKTRHDEMAELGIYFDSMTQKISGLLESQKAAAA